MTTATDCRDCTSETDHCHETLIVHVDQTIECSGGTCVATTVAHLHLIPCSELSPACRCDQGSA